MVFSAYWKFLSIYMLVSTTSELEFNRLIDKANPVAQLLLGHFVALQILMAPITVREWTGRIMATPSTGSVGWMEGIHKNLPHFLRPYLNWPLSLIGAIQTDCRNAYGLARLNNVEYGKDN
jgi:hypothetical protein